MKIFGLLMPILFSIIAHGFILSILMGYLSFENFHLTA